MQNTYLNKRLWEFSRYLLVGALAFVIDFSLLVVSNTYLLPDLWSFKLYIATALGFIAGIILNYILSITFVFRDVKDRAKAKTFAAFLIFAFIGMLGLLFTELGMYIGVDLLKLSYIPVKIFITGIVLLWNYIARKQLIFK